MICRACHAWRLCIRIGSHHLGLRRVKDPQETWERLWAGE